MSTIFILITITVMNANDSIEYSPECYDIAESAVQEAKFYAILPDGFLPGIPLTHEEEYNVFQDAYDRCDDTYNDNFQFPPF
ncbi:MAG: hypothetical protein ABF265_10450 [Polaribacter sp.]